MLFSATRRLLVGLALFVAPVVVRAQIPPLGPAAISHSAESLPSLLSPSQVKGSYKKYLLERYAHDREAQAVIHLFKRKQRGGLLWMGTMGGLMGFLAAKSGTHTNADGSTTTVSVTPFGWGLQAGLFLGVGLRKEIRFGNQQLYGALAAHDKGQPFPGYVDNKLKDKDYQ